jgi:hypothetical protein
MILKHLIEIAASGLLFTGTIIAQFEGTMDMKVTGAEDRTEENLLYTMAIKNNLMSAIIKSQKENEGAGKFIFRGDKKVVWILNDKEKSYLEISLDEEELKGKDTQIVESAEKISKTGKKETILGYECEEVIVESKEGVTHLWGTKKLGDLYGTLMNSFAEMGGKEEGNKQQGWSKEIEKLSMFPLRVVSKEDNKVVLTQEVTKIEPKKIADSEFDVPKGYKKQTFEFDIQNMMKKLDQQGKKHKEKDKNDPGENIDMEQLMKQLNDMQKDEDTSDGGY